LPIYKKLNQLLGFIVIPIKKQHVTDCLLATNALIKRLSGSGWASQTRGVELPKEKMSYT
jgi:hypothetical protein